MHNRIIFFAIFLILLSGCRTVTLYDAENALARGEYFEAQKIYRKVYANLKKPEDRPQRGEVAFKLGLCYDKLNIASRASLAFQNAIRYNYPDSIVYLYLGKALQADGKYQQAIDIYNEFLSYSPGNKIAIEAIKGCQTAIVSKGKPQTRYVVKEAKIFNSRRADFAPMYLDKSFDRLYLTSANEKAIGEKHSEVSGLKRGDIYVSRKDENGQWLTPIPATGEINTAADEGIVSFSPDGNTMYYSRADKSESQSMPVEIYRSIRTDASWSEGKKFIVLKDSMLSAAHPAVSADGNFLYFISDMPGGYGGLDIWKIPISNPSATPVNLGPQINTPGNEMFPYSRTDSLFYFASDGHPGYGGLDIFKARLNSSGEFWNVENMGQPINSNGDDFGITFGSGEMGFFSSNRNDARGYDHIYSFELPDIHVSISGMVVDRDEEPIGGAIIRIVGDDGSNQRQVAKDDGSFTFNLDRGVRYVMKAGASGYLNVKQEFTSDDTEEDAEYGIDFILTAINKPQVVENIFYDFDKATLRPESKAALEEVVNMLNENQNVTIEMASHTDRKGGEEYNLALSERRAKSVVDYLIASGIAEDRLFPKGYGKSSPKTVTKKIHRDYPQFEEGAVLTPEFIETLTPENQDKADQINRRTEFRILSIDYEPI